MESFSKLSITGPDVPKYCSWDAPAEPPVCSAHHYQEGLIYLAHQAGAEVYPSLGGWSLSDPFPAMAANPKARENFARQCVELIKSYNFDGIDIDWEVRFYSFSTTTLYFCFYQISIQPM